jgi:hypothetical protein
MTGELENEHEKIIAGSAGFGSRFPITVFYTDRTAMAGKSGLNRGE